RGDCKRQAVLRGAEAARCASKPSYLSRDKPQLERSLPLGPRRYRSRDGVRRMSIQYIRDYYKVPAKVGGKVIAYGKPGVITGTNGPYLMIRYDGSKHARPHHPTDRIEYLDAFSPSSETRE